MERELLQAKLKTLAREISFDLSALEAAESKELLSDFVSDLFLTVTEQQRKKERSRKQSERIAAAKMTGVRFGRPALPLPDNFDDIHHAWRGGQLTLGQAAESCGMPVATFYSKAVRREQSADSN